MWNLSGIYIYPIKSLAGISLAEAELTPRGLKYDRRWLLVDSDNKFLTQRTLPQLSLIQIALLNEGLLCSFPGADNHIVPYIPTHPDPVSVQIWEDVIPALYVSDESDRWFSHILGFDCRLVYMPDASHRQIDLQYASPGDYVSFADAYPYLILGHATLDELNKRLTSPVPMNRFRPNLVFQGGTPFEEDTWRSIRIGEATFSLVKPCARCVVITIDQETGEKGTEPLTTLSTFRKQGNKVLFGQNALCLDGNIVRLGDPIFPLLNDNPGTINS